MGRLRALAALVAGATVVMWASGTSMAQDTPPSALATPINSFGFRTLAAVGAGKNANVCLSPVSIHLALDMTRAGAAGETATQMDKALGVDGMSPGTLDTEAAKLLASLNTPDPGVTVTVANSLWIDVGARLRPDFVTTCKQSFGAEVANLDLKSPASIDRINQWVSDKTNGKIDHILSARDTGESAILANALYFKGGWRSPFSQRATADKPFHRAGGQADVTVPLMAKTESVPYYENAAEQVAMLPFADGRYGFLVALPKTADGLGALVGSLSAAKWNEWQNGLADQYGEIAMPKFKMTYNVTLNDTLEAMGMPLAFSRTAADFSKMAAPPSKLYIDFVKHDTYLSVDENGAEAAAATVVGMAPMAIMRPRTPAFQMIVDHPFFCAIVDTTTGAILFEGAVYDPLNATSN